MSAPKSASEKRPSMLFLALCAGAALALAAVLLVGLGRSGEAEDAPSTAGTPDTADQESRAWGESLARRDPDDGLALGDVDAPVVLIAYSDYQCPFCATWALETQPELVERYVESGDLRIEWREFPYMGDSSRLLATGARAAAEQDGFWEYHAAVFGNQDEIRKAGSGLEALTQDAAADAGLDTERFTEDLVREDLAAKVDLDFTEGQQLGVSGTPAFIVNGVPVMGAQPLSVFTAAIDSALSDAGR